MSILEHNDKVECLLDDDELTPFSIEAVRQVAEHHALIVVVWDNNPRTKLYVDATTASMFIKVLDSLKPHVQALVTKKSEASQAGFLKAVDLFWGAVR